MSERAGEQGIIYIDSALCNGCGSCIDACPHRAISVSCGLATVNSSLCRQCGVCIEACPDGAIKETANVNEQNKGGVKMVYGYGRGRGQGGCGLGFRGISPSSQYIGRGRGGLPRCYYPGAAARTAISREDELDTLKNQAKIMREQLKEIETSINKMEG